MAPTVVTDNTTNKETPRSLGSPVMTREHKVKRMPPAQGTVEDQCTADNTALPKTQSAIDVTREDTMDHSAEQRTSGMWMLRTVTYVLHTWITSLKIRVQHGLLQ